MKLHKKYEPWIFLALPLLFYLGVEVIPVFSSIYYSTLEWNGIGQKVFIGLGNYVKMWNDATLREVFKNSLIYSALATVLQIGLGLMLAILVSQVTKGRNLLKVLLYTPVVLSGMAIAQTFKKLLAISPDGVVNALLEAIGLGSLRTAFLADMNLTLYVVCIIESIRYCGLYMVVFHSGFTGIDEEILEAAAIDGAKKRQIMTRIQIPMIRGVITNSLMLAVLGTLKAFEMPFILTNGGPGYASEVLSTYMYKITFNGMSYGYGSAISLLIVAECVVMYLLITRLTREKE